MRLGSISLRSGRSWWWVFGVLIGAPALALALLGLRVLTLERMERAQQMREQQAQLAHLADTALANMMSTLESELGRVEASPAAFRDYTVFILEHQPHGLLTSVAKSLICLFRKPDGFLANHRVAFITAMNALQRDDTGADAVLANDSHDLRHNWVTSHAEIGTPQSVLEAQAGHLSKRMSDQYKHISEKAARKASDELARVKAAQRAEARAKLEQKAKAKTASASINAAVFTTVVPDTNKQPAMVQ